MKLVFGDIGVRVKGYTAEAVYELFDDNGLAGLFKYSLVKDTPPFNHTMYLQSANQGLFKEGSTVSIYSYFITYITDMDTFLHILRVGILDPDAANSLIEELYLQGLIKPRNES